VGDTKGVKVAFAAQPVRLTDPSEVNLNVRHPFVFVDVKGPIVVVPVKVPIKGDVVLLPL